jgi:hypothetical protein
LFAEILRAFASSGENSLANCCRAGYPEPMPRTQIADSALRALWQGLLIQGALLAAVVLVAGRGDLLQAYCAAMVAALATAAGILYRRPTEATWADRLMIRFGVLPLAAIAYLALPWIAHLSHWLAERVSVSG